jgi:hypothetical protein
MYIISVIVLLVAEFNAQVLPKTASGKVAAQEKELQVR